MRIALYACPGSGRRARYIADAFDQGLKEHGIRAETFTRFRNVCADLAIAYGWVHQEAFEAYKAKGAQFCYFDLGYWNRRPSNAPLDGHYRLALNDWDTAKAMPRGMPDDRFKALGISLKKPHLNGQDIIIASMSEKAAKVHGYELNEWETQMRAKLSAMGLKFPITQRAKPNKKARPTSSIHEALANARILVTRHSNTAIDALVAGVPFYAEHGVGAVLSPSELTADAIINPKFSSEADRRQLLADVAYAQWTPPEMRSGQAWEFLRPIICG